MRNGRANIKARRKAFPFDANYDDTRTPAARYVFKHRVEKFTKFSTRTSSSRLLRYLWTAWNRTICEIRSSPISRRVENTKFHAHQPIYNYEVRVYASVIRINYKALTLPRPTYFQKPQERGRAGERNCRIRCFSNQFDSSQKTYRNKLFESIRVPPHRTAPHRNS